MLLRDYRLQMTKHAPGSYIEASLPYSQHPTTGLYHEPLDPVSTFTPHFLKIQVLSHASLYGWAKDNCLVRNVFTLLCVQGSVPRYSLESSHLGSITPQNVSLRLYRTVP
jgi:hypothetical protein